LTKSELREEIARQLLRAKADPLYFFSRTKTLDVDEPDPSKRIKAYPIHKKYLQNLIYLAETEKRLAIYKSRQMIVTTTMCGVAAREVLFKPGSYTAFVSLKEESAGKLIGRVKTYYDHLPSYWKLGLPIPQYYHAKKGIIVKMICHHPNGPDSIIQAYPEGGDQLRMDTYSLVYWDEVGLSDSEMCGMTYAAAVPALGKSGRLIMSSTPPRYPEHFWFKICSGTYLGQ
jgi:hypothetical protein